MFNKNNEIEPKNIRFKVEVRGSQNIGKVIASNEVWSEWMKLKDGLFHETETEFILKSTNNKEYIAKKSGELTFAGKFTRFLSAAEKGSIWLCKDAKTVKHRNLNPEEKALIHLLEKEKIAAVLG